MVVTGFFAQYKLAVGGSFGLETNSWAGAGLKATLCAVFKFIH